MTPGGCRTSNTSGPSGDPLHETTQMAEARRRPCKPPCLQHYVVLLLSGHLLSCRASSWWKRPAPPKKARIGKPLLKEYNQSKSTMTALIRRCHRILQSSNPPPEKKNQAPKGIVAKYSARKVNGYDLQSLQLHGTQILVILDNACQSVRCTGTFRKHLRSVSSLRSAENRCV